MLLNEDELNELYEKWVESGEENWEIFVAKTQLKKVIEWGEETCPDHNDGTENQLRKKCWRCWQELKREIE